MIEEHRCIAVGCNRPAEFNVISLHRYWKMCHSCFAEFIETLNTIKAPYTISRIGQLTESMR